MVERKEEEKEKDGGDCEGFIGFWCRELGGTCLVSNSHTFRAYEPRQPYRMLVTLHLSHSHTRSCHFSPHHVPHFLHRPPLSIRAGNSCYKKSSRTKVREYIAE